MGATGAARLFTCQEATAVRSRSHCAGRNGCYAGGTKGEQMKVNPEVEAATARYIDSLGAANLEKAHDYTVGGHWLLL